MVFLDLLFVDKLNGNVVVVRVECVVDCVVGLFVVDSVVIKFVIELYGSISSLSLSIISPRFLRIARGMNIFFSFASNVPLYTSRSDVAIYGPLYVSCLYCCQNISFASSSQDDSSELHKFSSPLVHSLSYFSNPSSS